jgi:CRP-like cAMP-binding protein
MIAVVAANKRENDKRLRTLRDKLEKAQAQRNDELCEVILEEMETLEPDSSRWPHRRGDVLRKLGRVPDALKCYERAVALYAQSGFLPRAIAMAKVMVEIDPASIAVLQKIDASAARELGRRLRPEGVRVGELPAPARSVADAAAPLEPVEAPKGEVKFSAAPARHPSVELTEVELAERPPRLPSIPEQAVLDDSPREAERQACLPLLPLFAEAPPAALVQLARESELVTLPHGASVVKRGDPADALYGIVDGAVRVIVPGLAEALQPRLTAGDMFGEACLLSTEPRRADVQAEGELTALRIPKPTLNDLVRQHRGIADVLFEMLTRRLLANFLQTARLFAELSPSERREVAAEFELRRARAGTELMVRGKRADAVFITLTGQVEIAGPSGESHVEGAGMMFGHASMLEGSPCDLEVRTVDTLLVLRLPKQAFSRVAMQYPAILMRLAELEPMARVGH